RRVARPKPPVEWPRVARERRLEAARQVRLVVVALADESADGVDAARVRGAVETRGERRRADGLVAGDGRGRVAEPLDDVRQAPIERGRGAGRGPGRQPR